MRFSDSNNFARNVCGLPPSYHADMAVIDAHRPKKGWFCRDVTYDGWPLSLMFEVDEDGMHLTEIQAQFDGREIGWIPRHIAGLIKAQAIDEMNREEL